LEGKIDVRWYCPTPGDFRHRDKNCFSTLRSGDPEKFRRADQRGPVYEGGPTLAENRVKAGVFDGTRKNQRVLRAGDGEGIKNERPTNKKKKRVLGGGGGEKETAQTGCAEDCQAKTQSVRKMETINFGVKELLLYRNEGKRTEKRRKTT